MLLLDKEKVNVSSARKVVVLSDNEYIQNKVSQLLRTRGLENVELVSRFFLAEDISFNEEESVGVIIDIKDETNLATITEHINAAVPQNMWCCVIGNSDSISLSQKLLEQGVLYFNSDSQLHIMAEKIATSAVNIARSRNTVKVYVLGCKGGIGSSFISAQVANQIIINKKVPTLLAQGNNGSQDLDLMFDRKLQGDVVKFNEHLDLFNGDVQTLNADVIDKYNFIIYDQPIFNVNKDDFSQYLERSSNFVLVVERRIASLRVAKQFLDYCERVRNTTGKAIRTFICISDSRQDNAKLMAKSDIETLLGVPVDAVIPYLKKTNGKTVLSNNLSKANQRTIYTLAMKVIGVLARNNYQKENKSLFRAIYNLLLDK